MVDQVVTSWLMAHSRLAFSLVSTCICEPITSPLLARVRGSVIGDDQMLPGPHGPRRVTYADYTASG